MSARSRKKIWIWEAEVLKMRLPGSLSFRLDSWRLIFEIARRRGLSRVTISVKFSQYKTDMTYYILLEIFFLFKFMYGKNVQEISIFIRISSFIEETVQKLYWKRNIFGWDFYGLILERKILSPHRRWDWAVRMLKISMRAIHTKLISFFNAWC